MTKGTTGAPHNPFKCELSWDGPVPRDVGFNFGQRVGNVDFCLGLQKTAASAQQSCG